MAEKYDVFVGNLTFNTTEDQLREMFAYIGPVKSVRVLQDKETGKPKGFAFVEFFDINCALAAIRHLDGAELNSRKIKVGAPTQSNLMNVARQQGHIINENENSSSGAAAVPISTAQLEYRKKVEQNIINGLQLHEAWDMLDAMKTLIMNDKRGTKVKAILEAHPQLVNAMYELQKRLGIVLPAHIQQQQQQQALAAAVDTASFPPPPQVPNLPPPGLSVPMNLPPPPPRPSASLVGKAPPSSVSSKQYHNQPYGNPNSAADSMSALVQPNNVQLNGNLDLNTLLAHVAAGGELPADLSVDTFNLLSATLLGGMNNNSSSAGAIPAAPVLSLPSLDGSSAFNYSSTPDNHFQDTEESRRRSRFN